MVTNPAAQGESQQQPQSTDWNKVEILFKRKDFQVMQLQLFKMQILERKKAWLSNVYRPFSLLQYFYIAAFANFGSYCASYYFNFKHSKL